jgi:TPR repeat protein/serine/threonine protein kinase
LSFIEKYDNGSWRIVELIGEGTFGKVYKIAKKELSYEYYAALKVIPVPNTISDLDSLRAEGYDEALLRTYMDERVESIMKEVRFVMDFEGTSNIVSYQDHAIQKKEGELGYVTLLRMELLKSLAKESIGKTFTEEEVVKIGIDICQALELLAKNGTIHRDVKPENIFLSKHGDYKLGDFGIARQIEHTLTAGTRAGSPNYMAPEVYAEKKYGATVDLYSLGLVMHRLLNNKKLPFISANSASLSQTERDGALGKRMSGDQVPPPEFASQELSKVILKACDYNPENRFKTASEMKQALMSYKNPVVPEQPPIVPEPVAGSEDVTMAIEPIKIAETEYEPVHKIQPRHKNKNMRKIGITAGTVAIICILAFVFVPKIRMNGYLKSAEGGNVQAQIELGNLYYHGISVEKDYIEAAKWYRKAAEQGDDDGQNIIATRFYYGEGVAQDYAEAAKWYAKAAEQGNADAQNNLGNCYYAGNGVEQDYHEAVEWYKRAANNGYAVAQNNLGNRYYNGEGVEKDYNEAAYWYRKAAEQGNATGQGSLGDRYFDGEGVAQDYAEAVNWYRKAAEQGDAYGQYQLGNSYYGGNGVKQDYAEAVNWYRKAAKQGDVHGQCMLGNSYYAGQGVKKDYYKAMNWYRKSAEQGYAVSQRKLGDCYYNGNGVEQNYDEAVKWYRKSADQGNAGGQNNLGTCYFAGYGVDRDYDEAVKWYRKAAEQGEMLAQMYLGNCYYLGLGIEYDYTEAAKWLLKSAEQGNAIAQNQIGLMYRVGKGVEQSSEDAEKWFQKAAEQGNLDAKNNLDSL